LPEKRGRRISNTVYTRKIESHLCMHEQPLFKTNLTLGSREIFSVKIKTKAKA
jgi:hypothetical protein